MSPALQVLYVWMLGSELFFASWLAYEYWKDFK